MWERGVNRKTPRVLVEETITMKLNASAVLLANGRERDVALLCGEQTRTFGELRESVARAAAAWQMRGLKPGERIAVGVPDGFAWVDAVLGCIWAGGVAVPINPRFSENEWSVVLEEADFRFVLVEPDTRLPPGHRAVVVAPDELIADQRASDPVEAMQVEPTQPAIWAYSSGTSGKSKAIVHGHRFAIEIERIIREVVGVDRSDRIFATSKLFFAYPQTNSLFAGLKLGASVVLDPRWPTAIDVAATVAASRPTVLCSVPSLYRNLLKEGLAEELVRNGVRRFVSAGEALSADLREEWKRRAGVSIVNGYGASETLVLVLTDRDDGRGLQPSPGISVTPLNTGADKSPTRVCIGGSAIALGYLNRPREQAEHFRDGMFCPSDLFEIQENGSYRFVGREGTLVKVHGRWVDLVAIEEKLGLLCPEILEAAAVLVPDADGLDAIAVFYVPRNGIDVVDLEAALRAHTSSMPSYQRPRQFHSIDSLPRTPTGKLLRRRLQEFHLNS